VLPSESADALTCDFAPLFLLSRLFLAPAPAPVVREDPADADTRAAALSTVRCDGSDVLARAGRGSSGGAFSSSSFDSSSSLLSAARASSSSSGACGADSPSSLSDSEQLESSGQSQPWPIGKGAEV